MHHDHPPREKLTLCRVLMSVVVVLAAAACDSVVRACCHRLPIHVHDHHHAPSLLLGQRCRDCFWYVCTWYVLPVLGGGCLHRWSNGDSKLPFGIGNTHELEKYKNNPGSAARAAETVRGGGRVN